MRFDALSQLLSAPESFAAGWPCEPVLYEGTGRRVAALFSLDDAEQFLTNGALQYPLATLAKSNARLPRQSFTFVGRPVQPGYANALWPLKVQGFMEQGATVILESLQRTFRPLGDFCRRLAYELNTPVGVNAYLTPRRAQGFAHHYDTHGVLIVQCHGEKTWQLFSPVFEDPLESQPFVAEQYAGTDYGEARLVRTLRPGDVLWIPRGWIHNGFATEQPSYHLSFSIAELTRHWLLAMAVGAVAMDSALRTRCTTVAESQGQGVREELAVALQEATRWILAEENFHAFVRRAQGEFDGYFLEPTRPVLDAVRDAGGEQLGQLRPVAHAVRRVRKTPEGDLVVVTAEQEVVVPKNLAWVVDRIVEDSSAPFVGAGSSASHAPELTKLLRDLYRAGVAAFVTERPDSPV